MSFSASIIQIVLRYEFLGQKCQTAREYAWDGAAIAGASPDQLGEAWWNHYKTAWRALAWDQPSLVKFESVLVREVGGSFSYGEYAVPVLEQKGTRAASSVGYMPSYCAVGVRLTVGTTVTRPGQMRVPFLLEEDCSYNDVQAGFLSLVNTLTSLYVGSQILGAPTATGVITPSVVTYGGDPDTITADQPIIGKVINSSATTQVSRRKGHGN